VGRVGGLPGRDRIGRGICRAPFVIRGACVPKPNSQQHQQTQQDLSQLITQLDYNLQRYEQAEPFPQVNLSKGECKSCSFALRCQRIQETDDHFWEFNVNKLPNLAKIEEIPI
jgi:hypothetical protein